MKVALITYTRTKNYGGILQAYGLYSYLRDTGRNVDFIDYIPERCNINDLEVYTKSATRLSKIWGFNRFTEKIWQLLRYPAIKDGYKPFLEFLNSRATFTKPYYSMEELQNDPPQADIYITGSDQVWNSSFVPGEKVDAPFYLGFAEGKKSPMPPALVRRQSHKRMRLRFRLIWNNMSTYLSEKKVDRQF